MKIAKTLFFLLPVPILWALFPALGRHPVSFFLLRGSEGQVEAFRITCALNGTDPTVQTLRLDASQQKEGDAILAQGDVQHLLSFAKALGPASAVIGMPSTEEKWPGYLGGGLRGWEENGNGIFDNLQWSDRIYLAFAMKTPPPAPFLTQAAPAAPATTAAPAPVSNAAAALATPAAPSLVRVEILNGCGITNAADWVARRVKGPGIIITDTGNADNFNYGKTLIRSSAGTPVALEDAADRLGLSPDSIEETDHPVPGVDAVVVVGRDFPKLRRRWSGRIRHGTE
jgi:hypothetical protein